MTYILRCSLLILSLLWASTDAFAVANCVRYPSGTPVQCISLADISGIGVPGGDNGSVQYNNSGTFGGFGMWDGMTFYLGDILFTHGGKVLELTGDTGDIHVFDTNTLTTPWNIDGNGAFSFATGKFTMDQNAVMNSVQIGGDASQAYKLFVSGSTGDAASGIVLWDGGTNDRDFSMFIDGSGYLEFSPAGFASGASGIISSFNFGINMQPQYPLDVTGTTRVQNNNLAMLFIDPDDLYASIGDISGSYGNHDYIEVNDNASTININAHSLFITGGTTFIGNTNLYQTGGIQVGSSTSIPIVAEAAYSFKTGTLPSGSFTENGGAILSYAINEGQIGTRDTSIVGGVFRLDTRTSGGTIGGQQSFILFGSPTGGSAFNNVFTVSLQTGETLFNAVMGNSCVGLTACGSDKFDVNGSTRSRGASTFDTIQKVNTVGDLRNCATSGTVTWFPYDQGSGKKAVMGYAAACLGASASYTFPTAFAHTPAVQTTNELGVALLTTLTTTTTVLTGTTSTGYIFIEGN